MPDGKTFPSCFGPYLRYAIDSNFENFVPDFEDSEKTFRLFEEHRFRLFLLVELKRADLVRRFDRGGSRTVVDLEYLVITAVRRG